MKKSFYKLLFSLSFSNFGDGIIIAGMPLLVMSITKDPKAVSAIAFFASLPWLLISLPVGAYIDRIDKKKFALSVNFVRGVLLLVLFFIILTGNLSYWSIAAIAFFLGCAEVCFDTTAFTLVPLVADKEQLQKANSRLFSMEVMMNNFVGKPIGPILISTIGQVVYALFASVIYIVSSFLMLTLKFDFAPVEISEKKNLLQEIADGFKYLKNNLKLTKIIFMTSVINFSLTAVNAVLILFVTEELKAPDWSFGFFQAFLALGALSGNIILEKVLVGISNEKLVKVSTLFFTLGLAFTPVGKSVYVAIACFYVIGVATMLWRAGAHTIQHILTPESMMGRINSIARFINWGAIPLGAIFGGFIADKIGLAQNYFIFAGLSLISFLLALTVKGEVDMEIEKV